MVVANLLRNLDVILDVSTPQGQRLHGLLGVFIFPLAIYATCPIGKPDSPWAHHRYGTKHPKKQAKAEGRFPPGRRTERFKEAIRHGRRQAQPGHHPRDEEAVRLPTRPAKKVR